MEKLNLPIIKQKISKIKNLSMDDYVKFVNLNIRYTLDRKIDREIRKLRSVEQAFLIK